MKQEADPRTSQFIEAIIFVGILLAIHCCAFIMAKSSMGLISRGYLVFCCLVLPLASLAASIILRLARGWQWGQVTFVIFLALLFGFIQFLIVGSVSAVA